MNTVDSKLANFFLTKSLVQSRLWAILFPHHLKLSAKELAREERRLPVLSAKKEWPSAILYEKAGAQEDLSVKLNVENDKGELKYLVKQKQQQNENFDGISKVGGKSRPSTGTMAMMTRTSTLDSTEISDDIYSASKHFSSMSLSSIAGNNKSGTMTSMNGNYDTFGKQQRTLGLHGGEVIMQRLKPSLFSAQDEE